MAGHEQPQPKTGEYVHKVDGIFGYEFMAHFGEYPSVLPDLYSSLYQGYFEALGQYLFESSYFQLPPEKRAGYDSAAADYIIRERGLSGIAPLLFPNAEERLENEFNRDRMSFGHSERLEEMIQVKRESFKSWDGLREVVGGWSENTKRNALYKGFTAGIGVLDAKIADLSFPSNEGPLDPGAVERISKINVEINTCRELQRQLRERK